MGMTHELTDGLVSDVGRARRLYGRVRDEIPHSNDAGHEIVTWQARKVLSAWNIVSGGINRNTSLDVRQR